MIGLAQLAQAQDFRPSMPVPAGWSVGKTRADFSPFKNEKPLFTIDASNVDKYVDSLSPGQILQIKQVKGYRMDVYPSHRTCGNPDFVIENSRKNMSEAKIAADGSGLGMANLPGIPFPAPKTGIEALWNYLVHYQGIGFVWPEVVTYISPRAEGASPLRVSGPQYYYAGWGAKGGTTPAKVNDVLFSFAYEYKTPTALAGQALVQTFSFAKGGSDTYFYFPGQRRVRRMPTYAYDAPVISFENQYTVDQANIFFGYPDRYDWKIIGKRSMVVPYNNFAMYNGKLKTEDVFQPTSVNPDYRRYETHNVLQIEGTVKEGVRHSSPKRVMYLDLDSWIVVAGDDYDVGGKIWKVKEGYNIPSWEVGACQMATFAQFDVATGRYLVDGSTAGTGKDMYWVAESKDAKFTQSYYSAEQLQSRSER